MANCAATLTLIGGPTVLIELSGVRLLTDPTFDPPGTYRAGEITLAKHKAPALAPSSLGPVDAVLLSHDQHLDNLDYAGRAVLVDVACGRTTRAGAHRLRGGASALDIWQTTTIRHDGRELHVTATPARHGPRRIEPMSATWPASCSALKRRACDLRLR